MKKKTAELTGVALDWAVAKSIGLRIPDKLWLSPYTKNLILSDESGVYEYSPSTNWAKGGSIIEREKISIIRCDDDNETDANGFWTDVRIPVWAAEHGGGHSSDTVYNSQGDDNGDYYTICQHSCLYGKTPLEAAMRCYVESRVGKDIDIPDELC